MRLQATSSCSEAGVIARFVVTCSPGCTISTFAGTGTPGFSGDGGPASNAKLDSPTDVLYTGSGTILITDQGNERVRSVGGRPGPGAEPAEPSVEDAYLLMLGASAVPDLEVAA